MQFRRRSDALSGFSNAVLIKYQDSRFDQSFDKETGYHTRSMIVVPIVDFEGQCTGVIQAINKMPSGFDAEIRPRGKLAIPFSRQDERMLLHLAEHIAIALQNAEVYREAINCSDRATGLLNTIQSMSQDLGPQSLLLMVTMHASKVCSAQRCSVFLLDEAAQQLWSVSTDTGAEIRIPKDKGIAGECCCQGKVINIPDAYADPRFNKQVDIQTGYRTRSILAVPIIARGESHTSHVVGVIQMINKVAYDGQLEYFDDEDVEIMELFASFVGPKTSLMLSGTDKKEVLEGRLALGLEIPTSSGSQRGRKGSKKSGLEDNFAKFYVAGVVLAFDHLHGKKIIYRDLKPENLLLNERGCIKLTDMGLAKICVGKTYTACGTPDYFAPELIASTGHTNAVDWWTLGIFLFELLSGHPPFESSYPMQTYQKIMRGIAKVAFPPKCKGSAEDLVKSLCKHEPSERLPMKKGGSRNIKSHPFYKGFDWTAFETLRMTPPYRPVVKSKRDYSNFSQAKEMPPMVPYEDDGSKWDADFATCG
ncbi:Prkg1 [Symbiodinium sp. KB8]|nr:Prkg1 [Symbiodinium sp. KB8]